MTALAVAAALRPRLVITGPMLGRNAGFVTTQGEFLTDLLREAGYEVASASVRPGRLARLLEIVATLRRELSVADAAIVETYSGPSFVVEDISSWLVRARGKPVIMHLHGGAMPAFARRFPNWTRRVLHRAAAVVAPSAFLARELAAFAPDIRIIPNIIELEEYHHRLRERVAPRLFWMRAYHRIYNPVMAIKVLARVRASMPSATLVMAGQEKGIMRDVVEAARSFEVTDAVEVRGFLDEREKKQVADGCDVFINTTHVDNAPVGVVEMCALGLPVVSTNVGGIADLLVDGTTGLLVPDGDADAMATAILRLVRDPSLAASLSRNGASVAAACAWPAVLAKWESLFAELLATRRGPR